MCKWLEELEARFKRDIQAIKDSYRETEIEFQEWKYREFRRIEKAMNDALRVLEKEEEREEIEHGEHCADDDSDGDHRICDREQLGSIQDQNDVPGDHEEDYGQYEGGAEEGHDTENMSYDDEFDDIYEGIARIKITEKRQKSKKPNKKRKK